MEKPKENKPLELNYDKKYYFFMLLFKISWTIFTGAAAIIILGESSFSSEYVWNYISICMATIAVLYATMFNTPEKLKNSSKALKDNTFLVCLSILAVLAILVIIIFLLFFYSERKLPPPLAVSIYFGVTLASLYFVTFLDKHFSKD